MEAAEIVEVKRTIAGIKLKNIGMGIVNALLIGGGLVPCVDKNNENAGQQIEKQREEAQDRLDQLKTKIAAETEASQQITKAIDQIVQDTTAALQEVAGNSA